MNFMTMELPYLAPIFSPKIMKKLPKSSCKNNRHRNIFGIFVEANFANLGRLIQVILLETGLPKTSIAGSQFLVQLVWFPSWSTSRPFDSHEKKTFKIDFRIKKHIGEKKHWKNYCLLQSFLQGPVAENPPISWDKAWQSRFGVQNISWICGLSFWNLIWWELIT